MDQISKHRSLLISSILYLILVTGVMGCAFSPDRFHPDYAQFRSSMHHFLLLPPEVGLFKEMADGQILWQAENSRMARDYISQAVMEAMKAHALEVEPLDVKGPVGSELLEIQALYRNVNRSIQLHVFGPQEFVSKRQIFDYGLGPIHEVLQKNKADALVLVLGQQTDSARAPKTWLSIAIVEPQGRVAWYGLQGGREAVSLETPAEAAALVRTTLKTFLEDIS